MQNLNDSFKDIYCEEYLWHIVNSENFELVVLKFSANDVSATLTYKKKKYLQFEIDGH